LLFLRLLFRSIASLNSTIRLEFSMRLIDSFSRQLLDAFWSSFSCEFFWLTGGGVGGSNCGI
jgi:hypothetical protein